MSLLETIHEKLIVARKSRDKRSLSALSYVLGQIQQMHPNSLKKGESAIEQVIRTAINKSRETMEAAPIGHALIGQMTAEIEVLQKLLPASWSQEQIETALKAKVLYDGFQEFIEAKTVNAAIAAAMNYFKTVDGNQHGADVSAVVRRVWSVPSEPVQSQLSIEAVKTATVV